jgi:hypothetical protein
MKIWIAVSVGFLLGALLQPLPSLKAQVFGTHQIGVHIRHMADVHGDGMFPGSEVIGVYCLREGDATSCYVATRD